MSKKEKEIKETAVEAAETGEKAKPKKNLKIRISRTCSAMRLQ